MLVDRGLELLAHRRREGGMEVGLQLDGGAESAKFDRVLLRERGGREQYRELGAREAAALRRAEQECAVVGQPFDQPVEASRRLENLDQPDIARQCLRVNAEE